MIKHGASKISLTQASSSEVGRSEQWAGARGFVGIRILTTSLTNLRTGEIFVLSIFRFSAGFNTVFCTEINICGFILVPSLLFSIVPHFSALRNTKIMRGRMFITYTNSWSSCPEFWKLKGSARISGYKSSQVSPGQAWLCLGDPVWELVHGAALFKCQGSLFYSVLSYPHLRSSLFVPPGL